MKFKVAMLLLSFLVLKTAIALDCMDQQDKQRKIKSICHLEHDNTRIELHFAQQGCEFPEGNVQDCAYVSACQSDKSFNQKGRQVYRKGIDLKTFCTSAKKYKIDGKALASSLSGTSSNKKAKAYFLCPYEQNKSILMVIGNKQKKCRLPF